MCMHSKTLGGEERVDPEDAREEHTCTVTAQAKVMFWRTVNNGITFLFHCAVIVYLKPGICYNQPLNTEVKQTYHRILIV